MFDYERIYDGLFTFEHDNGELRHFKRDFLQYGKINTMICQNYGRGITIEHKKDIKSLSDERKAVILKYYFAKARQIRGRPQKSIPHKLPNSKQKTYFEFRNFILVPSQFSSGLCVVGANEQHVFRVNYGPIHIFMRKEKRAENEHISSRIETKYLKDFYHSVVNNQNMKILQANEIYFVLTQNCSLFYFENAKGRSPLIKMSYSDDFYDEDDDEDDDEYVLPTSKPSSGTIVSSSFPPEASTSSGFPSTSSGFPPEASTSSGFPSASTSSGFPSTSSGFPSTSSGFPSTSSGFPSSSNFLSEPQQTAASQPQQTTVSQPQQTDDSQPQQTVVSQPAASQPVVSQPQQTVVSQQSVPIVTFPGQQNSQAVNLLNAILLQPPEQQQVIFSQLQNLLKPSEQQVTLHVNDLNNLFEFYQNNT